MKRTQFNVDYNFFSGTRDKSVAIVSFKERAIMYTADLHENDIDAAQALQLGLVDKVVPATALKPAAIEVAKTYAEIPFSYVSGIKRLINYDTKILRNVLEYENDILQKGSVKRCPV